MKKRQLLTRTAAVGMAVTMSASLCACGGQTYSGDRNLRL